MARRTSRVPAARLRSADDGEGPRAQPRLRAAAVLAGDDAGAAGPLGPGPARHRGRRRRSAAATQGSPPRGSSPGAARRSTLLEARHARLRRLDPERRHRPSRLQVGTARRCSGATARRPARALYRDTLDAYDARQAADRRRGDRLRVARVRLRSSWPRPPPTSRTSSTTRASLATVGVEATHRARASGSARRSAATPTTAGSPSTSSGLLHPGKYFAGLAAAADRAGADLHEGVRARSIRRQGDGRFVVETERGAILAKEVLVATNGYTDGVAPGDQAADHADRQLHHRHASHSPRTWHGSCRRPAARSWTRSTSCTTGTCRRTAG